jgi:hypothetical protein
MSDIFSDVLVRLHLALSVGPLSVRLVGLCRTSMSDLCRLTTINYVGLCRTLSVLCRDSLSVVSTTGALTPSSPARVRGPACGLRCVAARRVSSSRLTHATTQGQAAHANLEHLES